MSQHNIIVRTLLSCLSVCAGIVAQSPQLVRNLDELAGLAVVDGIVRADGPGYRATFDARGMEFTPALGRRAPREHSLRIEATSVARGEEVVELRGSEPVIDNDALRVVYARADSIVERFDIAARGVEWSLVLKSRPRGRGDLVVTARAVTELRHRPGDDVADDDLRLSDGITGGVRIGAVVAIDARQRSYQGQVRWRGDTIELVVPAAFANAAEYPLLIDPWITADTTRQLSGGDTFDDRHPAIAWNEALARYLCVWEKSFSLNSIDVMGVLVDSGGLPRTSVLPIGSASTSVDASPAVASARESAAFLVTWRNGPLAVGPFDLYLRIVRGDGSMSPVSAFGSATVSEGPPVACGERATTGTGVLVAYESAGTIRARIVDVRAAPLGPAVGAERTLSTASTISRNPKVCRSFGLTGRSCVVWEEWPTASAPRVVGLLVGRDGVALTGVTQLFAGTEPSVDGDGDWFLVAAASATTLPSIDVQLWRFQSGFFGHTLVAGSARRAIAPSTSFDHTEPAVGFLRDKFVVAWSAASGLFASTAQLLAFDPRTCATCEDLLVVGGFGRESTPAIAARWGGGGDDDGSLVVWSAAPASQPFVASIYSRRFEAIGNGGAVTSQATGCAGGGALSLVGPFALAANARFQLTGAAATATAAALHLGGTATPDLICGTCQMITPFLALPLPLASGSAALDLRIGCSTDLVGLTLRAQAAVAGTSTAPCPLVVSFAVSNTLSCTFGF